MSDTEIAENERYDGDDTATGTDNRDGSDRSSGGDDGAGSRDSGDASSGFDRNSSDTSGSIGANSRDQFDFSGVRFENNDTRSANSGTGTAASSTTDEPIVRRRRGRPRTAEGRRTDGTGEPTEESVVEVVSAPRNVEFRDASDKSATRKPRQTKGIAAGDTAQLICALLVLYAMTRPYWVRKAWDYAPNDVEGIAVPLTRMLNRLPTRAVAMVQNMMDPLLLLMGFTALISASQEQERRLNREFQAEVSARQNGAYAAASNGTFASQNGSATNGNGGDYKGQSQNSPTGPDGRADLPL